MAGPVPLRGAAVRAIRAACPRPLPGLALLLALAATPAVADWDVTRFGMTGDEVVAFAAVAQPGFATALDALTGGIAKRLEAAGDGLTYDAIMGFGADGAATITLSPQTASNLPCIAATDALEQLYGQAEVTVGPAADNDGPGWEQDIWRETADGNAIRVYFATGSFGPSDCLIVFSRP